MKDLLASIHQTLRVQRAELKEKDDMIEEDESIQDDTKWVNDYHNQQGYIEGLKLVVGMIQHRLKAKKKK